MIDEKQLLTYYLINNFNQNIESLPCRIYYYYIVLQEEHIYVYNTLISSFFILKIYNPNEKYNFKHIEEIFCYQQSIILIYKIEEYNQKIKKIESIFEINKNVNISDLISMLYLI